MACIKRAKQADALFRHLEDIYKKATDFAANRFQSYIDTYNEYNDEDGSEFNPFDELHYHFDNGMITDLPPNIERYQELIALLSDFSEYRKKFDEGFNEFFGDALETYHVATDEEGKEVMLPISELPGDVINEIDANREIEGISIEYCLDGYNEFYKRCRLLIETHRSEGTIVECSQAILSLYAPYSRAKLSGTKGS